MQSGSTNGVACVAAALRFLALWLGVQVLIAIPAFIENWRSMADYGAQASFVAANLRVGVVREVSSIVVAVTLWSTSSGLAQWVWQQPSDDLVEGPTAVNLQQAVFAGLGAYLIVSGLPSVTEVAFRYFSVPAGFDVQQDYKQQLLRLVVSGVIQIGAGAGLLFGSSGLTSLLARLRSGPDAREEAEDMDVADPDDHAEDEESK